MGGYSDVASTNASTLGVESGGSFVSGPGGTNSSGGSNSQSQASVVGSSDWYNAQISQREAEARATTVDNPGNANLGGNSSNGAYTPTYTDPRTGMVFASKEIAASLGYTSESPVNPYNPLTQPGSYSNYQLSHPESVAIQQSVAQKQADAANAVTNYAAYSKDLGNAATQQIMADKNLNYSQALLLQTENAKSLHEQNYYQNEYQKSIQNFAATSAATHAWAVSTGLPTGPNPYEYTGDLALGILKGYGGKSGAQIVTPTDLSVLNLPNGIGIQDAVWNQSVGRGKVDYSGYNYATDVLARAAATGEMGIYGTLKSYSSTYGDLSIPQQQDIAIAAAKTAGWNVYPEKLAENPAYGFYGLGYGRSFVSMNETPTEKATSISESLYTAKLESTAPANYFIAQTSAQQALPQDTAITRLESVFQVYGHATDITLNIIPSLFGQKFTPFADLNARTGLGAENPILTQANERLASANAGYVNYQQGYDFSAGAKELSARAAANVNAKGEWTGSKESLDLYNQQSAQFNAAVQKGINLYSTTESARQQALASGAYVVRNGDIVVNPIMLRPYGSASDWGVGAYDILMKSIGVNREQFAAYDVVRLSQPAIVPESKYGIAAGYVAGEMQKERNIENFVYGFGKELYTNPEGLVASGLSGAQIYAVTAGVGGIVGELSQGTGFAARGASVAIRAGENPFVQYALPAAFVGQNIWQATGGFTLPAAESSMNLGTSGAHLAAMGVGGVALRYSTELPELIVRGYNWATDFPEIQYGGSPLTFMVREVGTKETPTLDLTKLSNVQSDIFKESIFETPSIDLSKISTVKEFIPMQKTYEPFFEGISQERSNVGMGGSFRSQETILEPARNIEIYDVRPIIDLSKVKVGTDMQPIPANLNGRTLSMVERSRLQTQGERSFGFKASRQIAKENLERLRMNNPRATLTDKEYGPTRDVFNDHLQMINSIQTPVVLSGLKIGSMLKSESAQGMESPNILKSPSDQSYHKMQTEEHMPAIPKIQDVIKMEPNKVNNHRIREVQPILPSEYRTKESDNKITSLLEPQTQTIEDITKFPTVESPPLPPTQKPVPPLVPTPPFPTFPIIPLGGGGIGSGGGQGVWPSGAQRYSKKTYRNPVVDIEYLSNMYAPMEQHGKHHKSGGVPVRLLTGQLREAARYAKKKGKK